MMNPDVRNNPIERENTLPPLSPLKRAAYQSKINTEFANRKITDITEHDLRTLKNSSLGHFLERCLTFITFFLENKTLIALLHEERETEFLLKAYTKLSKINLEKVEPEGIILPKTSRGKVHHTASLLFIKSIRQEWTIQQFDLIASSKVEKADIHVNKALLRCLRTVAHMSGISIKQKNFFTYFQQLLQELRKITDAEGKNVLEQVETLLKEKKELYRDLSTLYHTQWLLETSALDEEKSHEILKGLFLKHEQEIKDIDTTLPTILQISSAIQALESKVEKIDSFFRSLATTMTDKLSIFETTTDRLAREFSPEVLKKPVHVTMIGVEYSGLIKEGGLSEALEGLAVGMKKQHPDNQVRLIFPRFSSLPQAIREQLSHTPPKEYVDSTGEKINVRSLTINGVECLFIDHPLFSLPQEKPSIYGPTEAEMKTRFVKFSQLASDLLPQLGKTDIIHLHDWHVAGVAIKYKKDHLHEWEEGKTPPIVFTFHNNSRAAQGRYFQSVYNYDPIIQGLIQAGIASENLNAFVETLQIADSATTVSPTFALECQAVDSGEGISFATRDAAEKGKLFGIINGSNPERWNPATDEQLRRWKDPETHVPVDLTFGPDSPDLLEKKEQCKTQLSKWIKNNFPNTPFDEKKPIVTFIGRFDSYQKGLDKLE